MKHVSDIAEKYLIAGETQDTALMFVPSESVYAEIHDGFDDVIQKAYRARVVLVSPSLLMLAIQVMQQILKDARMRDAADQIRTEVLNLGDDLGRLRDRVLKLQKHFSDANEDVRQILISADKIEKRAGRIEELDFSKETPGRAAAPRQAGRARAVSAAAQAAGGGVDARLSSPGLTGRPSIPETADGGTQLLRLHSRQPHRRHALHRRDQRSHSPCRRAQVEIAESFTKSHDVVRLVYFEQFDDTEQAIQREKRLKKWTRAWKISLIEKDNPNWIDLYPEVAGGGG